MPAAGPGSGVPMVAPSGGTNDIRAIKPPVDIPLGPLPWLIGLAVALVLAGLLAWWYRRRKNRPAPPPPPPVPPHVRARQRLEQALALLSDPRLFCIAVSDAARLYLEERFTLHAPDRTTEEFLQELQRTEHLLPDQKITLGVFLEKCDLVKFARFEPTEAELRSLHQVATRLVEETVPYSTTDTAVSNPAISSATEPPGTAPRPR